MPYSTTRNSIKRQRAAVAHRIGQATIKARPESIRESLARSHGGGVGIIPESGRSIFPFESEAEFKEYSALYDGIAMGRISRALREPEVRARMTHDNGTAPELHLVGKFLNLGWIIEKEIIFQDKTQAALFGFRRRHRVFVSDVALQFSRFVLCPIDGEEFHNKLQIERDNDLNRNAALGHLGQVCAIPSRYCFEGRTLDDYLAQRVGVTV